MDKHDTDKAPTSSSRLGTMPIPKLILSMSLPAILSMFVQAMYNVVDSLFVANISEDALTAVSLAFPIQLLIVASFVGLGVGINANISKRLGQGKPQIAVLISQQGLFIGLILSLILALVGAFFTRTYFTWFTDNPWIIAEGTRYTQIVTILSLFRIFAQIATSTLQGSGQMIHPMVAQLLGAGINIVLDPILIFGFWIFPAWGVTGAAVATVVAQFISMLYIWSVLLLGKSPIKPKLMAIRPIKNHLIEILSVGLPVALIQGLGSMMLAGINLILAPFGATALAVMGVYFKLQTLVLMPVFGLNTGTLPVVGYNFGAKNRARSLSAIRFSTLMALCYMTLWLCVFQVFPKEMLAWFKAQEDMLTVGTTTLRLISLTFPLMAVTIILSGSLNALGKSTYSLLISAVRQIVILLPLAYFLGKTIGLKGVWLAFIASELVGILLTTLLFKYAIRMQLPKSKNDEVNL